MSCWLLSGDRCGLRGEFKSKCWLPWQSCGDYEDAVRGWIEVKHFICARCPFWLYRAHADWSKIRTFGARGSCVIGRRALSCLWTDLTRSACHVTGFCAWNFSQREQLLTKQIHQICSINSFCLALLRWWCHCWASNEQRETISLQKQLDCG